MDNASVHLVVTSPLCGSGTTMIAAMRTERNSIGIEIDPEYCRMAARYLKAETADLFPKAELRFEKVPTETTALVKEDPAFYDIWPAKKNWNRRKWHAPDSLRSQVMPIVRPDKNRREL